jgi:hypothetical protein
MLVAAAAICIHQFLVAYFIIFDDVTTASEAQAAKRRKHELHLVKEISQWDMVSQQPTLNMFHTWNMFFKVYIGLTWKMSPTFMGGNYSFLPIISRISLNAPNCLQMALVLQTTFTANVSLIIFITYITVGKGGMMVIFTGLKKQILALLVSLAYKRTQFMFFEWLWRFWRMNFNGQMQRRDRS